MCNYVGQLNTVHRFAVNAATHAGTQTAYCGDHQLDSPAVAPETGFKCPAVSQTKSFFLNLLATLCSCHAEGTLATACTPRNFLFQRSF